MPGSDNQEIVFMISAVISVLLFLVGIMIALLLTFQKKKFTHFQKIAALESAFQQQLLQSQIEVQENTSNALSKELHDNVGQLLTTTKMLMGLSERELEHIPDTLITAQETIGKAINELRSLSKSLDNDWLSRFSFIENLEQETIRINASGNTQLHISVNVQELSFNADEQIMVFRIVQESIQNALKHAKASRINILVNQTKGLLQVCINDNGAGFSETKTNNNGLGITNMKHRATILGGKLMIESEPGAGTNIIMEIPEKNKIS